MQKNQKGFSVVEGLLILVIVGLVAAVGWYVWSQKSKNSETTSQATEQAQPAESSATEQAPALEQYKDDELGFTFDYPEGWTVVKEQAPGVTPPYVNFTLRIKSPDFEETDFPSPGYREVLKGAYMSVHIQTLGSGYQPLEFFLNPPSGQTTINDPKPVTVAGQPGVEYVWKLEGPHAIMTMFRHNNLEFEINYKDTDNPDFNKYLGTYNNLVSSFQVAAQ